MQIRDQFCISSCRGTAGRGSLVAHNLAAKQHYEEWYGGAADLAGGCVAVDSHGPNGLSVLFLRTMASVDFFATLALHSTVQLTGSVAARAQAGHVRARAHCHCHVHAQDPTCMARSDP